MRTIFDVWDTMEWDTKDEMWYDIWDMIWYMRYDVWDIMYK